MYCVYISIALSIQKKASSDMMSEMAYAQQRFLIYGAERRGLLRLTRPKESNFFLYPLRLLVELFVTKNILLRHGS